MGSKEPGAAPPGAAVHKPVMVALAFEWTKQIQNKLVHPEGCDTQCTLSSEVSLIKVMIYTLPFKDPFKEWLTRWCSVKILSET